MRYSGNEETFFDVMYGTSEPLKGERVELRGQLPVSKLGSGRLFLGGSANFKASSATDDESNEADSLKVYLTWQTTFDDLLSSRSSSE